MIITRVDCGMGNQMFAYAAGYAVARRLGTELLLDTEWYRKKQPRKDPRPYELDCFQEIRERRASFRDVYKLFPFQAVINYLYGHNIFWLLGRHFIREAMTALMLLPEGKSRRRFLKSDPVLLPIPSSRVFTQEASIYSDKFMMIPDDTYIWGAWQNGKFFEAYREELRQKFTFPSEYFVNGYAEKIRSCNSTAVHVRLGDKLRHGEAGFTAEYVRCSTMKMLSLTEGTKFFVFSDNLEWCRKNLPVMHEAEYTFVDGNTPAQDMALMTICRHVVTSASTFSWWGAWLNDNRNKVVIAPSQKLWCSDDSYKDIYPPEWVIVG